jgi:indole-3-glycerol phosphate synthase
MSVSNLSKRRGTMLDEIMRFHRAQLPKIKRRIPLEDLRALASVAPVPVDFAAALTRKPGVALIAECKKASPSKGLMVRDYDPVALARRYVKLGAAAISVLTDGRHFQGDLSHLRDVKEALPGTPVLRKDFIFDPYQLYEARAAGADAVLLIAAVLSGNQLRDLHAETEALGMQALVEVHTEEELGRALAANPRVIGVNNRDLQTFTVDFDNTARLRQQIPAGIATVAESGLKTPADMRAMAEIGVDAVLVGETLVTSKNLDETMRALLAAGKARGNPGSQP